MPRRTAAQLEDKLAIVMKENERLWRTIERQQGLLEDDDTIDTDEEEDAEEEEE